MKKLIIALSILTIAFAGVATAQDLTWENNVGIYLADGSHATTAVQGEMVDLHVIISHMTSPAAGGFELKLVAEGSLIIVEPTIAYPTDAINAASRTGEYIVGYGTPIASVDASVEVMSFSAIVTADLPGALYIEPVYFETLANVPSYLADAENAIVVEMRQSTGGPSDPVFVVNTELVPVATESTTFDNLKSLYR